MNLFLCSCHTSSVHYSPICLSVRLFSCQPPGWSEGESTRSKSSWDPRPRDYLGESNQGNGRSFWRGTDRQDRAAGGGILRRLTLSHLNLEARTTARHTLLVQPCRWLGSHLEHLGAGPRLKEAWPFESVTLSSPLTQSTGAFRLGVLRIRHHGARPSAMFCAPWVGSRSWWSVDRRYCLSSR